MTRPDLADPVAARPDPATIIRDSMGLGGNGVEASGGFNTMTLGWARRAIEELAESGYVLVSADMLAEAMHKTDVGCEWNPVGRATHDGDHERDASRVFAALKGPAR